MYTAYKRAALVAAFCVSMLHAQAQNTDVLEGLDGDFQWDAAYYSKDSVIGTPEYPEKIGSNAYLHLLYDRGPFSAGLRFESYQPAFQGFDRRYNQSAIPTAFFAIGPRRLILQSIIYTTSLAPG